MNFFQLIRELLNAKYNKFASSGHLTNLDFTIVENEVFSLEGPIAIQVEYFTVDEQLFRFKLDKYIESKVKYVEQELTREPIIKNAILITNLDNSIINEFNENYSFSRKIKIWGSTDLNTLIHDYPNISYKFNDDFFVKVISEDFSRFILGSESRAEQIGYSSNRFLDNLRKEYKEKELVLFLGAGVSISANLPNWTELVSKVYFEALLNKGIQIKDIVRDPQAYWELTENVGNNNLLIRTKYAKLLLEEDFTKKIHKWLYHNSSRTSPLINTLSNLIRKTDNSDGRLINSVVTYNYDDLLETHLKSLDIPFTSVWKESQRILPSTVGIYHVHGFLPFKNEYSSDNIVFSEDEYHEQYKNPYSWSNVVQLNFFREKTCVFIGSTLSDPNTRRILDMTRSGNKGKQHYIIYPRLLTKKRLNDIQESSLLLKKLNTNPEYASLTNKLRYLLINEETIKETMLAEELLIERDFNNLGLNVIWIEDFNEIPEILNYLME